eukprot:5754361-Prymnesium_polylepis.1
MYQDRGQSYEARVDAEGRIVQRNMDTGKARLVRVRPAASASFGGGFWPWSADNAQPLESPFLDETGDHWTLLRTVHAFIEAVHSGTSGFQWCLDHNLPYDVLKEASETHDHICSTLALLKFHEQQVAQPSMTWASGQPPPPQLKQLVLEALFKSFSDHVAALKDPRDPSMLVRLVRDAEATTAAAHNFVIAHGPRESNGSTMSIDPEMQERLRDLEGQEQRPDEANPNEVLMRCASSRSDLLISLVSLFCGESADSFVGSGNGRASTAHSRRALRSQWEPPAILRCLNRGSSRGILPRRGNSSKQTDLRLAGSARSIPFDARH